MDLKDYQWKHRILMVFAPSETHPAYQRLAAEVQSEKARFEERDMLWIEVLTEGTSQIDTVRLTETQAQQLRTQFAVAPERFVALLIGKDGGVKLRQGGTVRLEQIFALIDTMPMRRSEMRQRQKGE